MGYAGDQTVRTWRVMYTCILLVFSFVLYSCSSVANAASATPTVVPTPENYPIKVRILNPNVIVAVVRVVGTTYIDDFDNNELALPSCFNGQSISVWSPGYFLQTIPCNGITPQEYDIPLTPIDANSILTYAWLSASSNCISCHSQSSKHNVYDEWNNSSHASMFRDRYFEAMYTGRNIRTGNVGKQTQWIISNDGKIRMPPGSTNPSDYTGPGFLLDYPGSNGNCAFCHVPASVSSQLTDANLSNLFPYPAGAVGESVSCDICHKVVDITLDGNNVPYTDRPGILSFQYSSMQANSQFSFGPLPHATTQNLPAHLISCFSVYSESSFCAACHYGKFSDMLIYSSYKEWMDTPHYSARTTNTEGVRENPNYRSCQDCHMLSPKQINNNPLPSQRDACSATNVNIDTFNHDMMHSNNQSLIKDAATLDVKLKSGETKNSMWVTVKVENTKAGHKFPTDSPLRHLILVVSVVDQRGNPLTQIDGEKIPVWGGVGMDTSNVTGMVNYGGMPGKIFADILVDKDTNISPTAAYWNPTKFVFENTANGANSDTRLQPNKPDESNYSFNLPSRGSIKVFVRLIYRYAFIELAQQKGWNRPDFEVTRKECILNVTHPETWTCP